MIGNYKRCGLLALCSLAFGMCLPGCDTVFAASNTPSGTSRCDNTCQFAFDGVCTDGGPNSIQIFGACARGTDCEDCRQPPLGGGPPPTGGSPPPPSSGCSARAFITTFDVINPRSACLGGRGSQVDLMIYNSSQEQVRVKIAVCWARAAPSTRSKTLNPGNNRVNSFLSCVPGDSVVGAKLFAAFKRQGCSSPNQPSCP